MPTVVEAIEALKDIPQDRKDALKNIASKIAEAVRLEEVMGLKETGGVLRHFQEFPNFAQAHAHAIFGIQGAFTWLMRNGQESLPSLYQVIPEAEANIRTLYLPRCDALLREMNEHPDRTQHGEEKKFTIITEALPLAYRNATELADAIGDFKQMMLTANSSDRMAGSANVTQR